MEGVEVTLVPNIEKDHQAFRFDELGISYFEWSKMSQSEKRMVILENIAENIHSFVESMEEY